MWQQRWLAVWLVNWPVQRRRCGLLSGDPQPGAKPAEDGPAEDKPLLLWDEEARSGRRVVATCERCQRWGVRLQMPLHEAIELARRATADAADTPPRAAADTAAAAPLQLERYDAHGDRQTLGHLADQLLLEISPLVAIEPLPERVAWAGLPRPCSETLLVNITGIGEWFGSEQAVLDATERLLDRHSLRAVLAIADSWPAAWGIARFGERSRTIVRPGQTVQAVQSLPIHALRITAEVAHQLGRLGIATVGQLRQLPRGGLAARLGSDLVRRLDQMFAAVEEPLAMHHSEPEDAATCELQYPTTDIPILQHRIGQLIDALAARLTAEVRGALRLSCRLDVLDGHPPQRIELGLFAPTADADHLRRLMMTSLEGKSLPAMVQRVSVSVDLSGPLRQFQATLFGEESLSQAAARGALARMIETVAMRLGHEAVVEVAPNEHPLPESAYVLRPLAGRVPPAAPVATADRRSGRRRSSSQSSRRSLLPPPMSSLPLGPLPSDPLRRPLRLFAPPLRVGVRWSQVDGQITHLQIASRPGANRSGANRSGRIYRVLRCWGPERIETAGISTDTVRRDYYRVEVADGAWFWLFRQYEAGAAESWHLHGRFD